MTDLEITNLCAQAMKIPLSLNPWSEEAQGLKMSNAPGLWTDYYRPLLDDAQAMALVKKFKMSLAESTVSRDWAVNIPPELPVIRPDLNRAICECVANMMSDLPQERQDKEI